MSSGQRGIERSTALLLAELAEHGPIRNADLARLLNRSPSATRQTLGKLARRGWVRQEDVLWEVTERGREEPRVNPVAMLPREQLSRDEVLDRQRRRPWAVLPNSRSEAS